MKYKSISFIILFSLCASLGFEAAAHSYTTTSTNHQIEKGKKKKNGRYKKRKHRLKKFLMGKRYCDCPKH